MHLTSLSMGWVEWRESTYQKPMCMMNTDLSPLVFGPLVMVPPGDFSCCGLCMHQQFTGASKTPVNCCPGFGEYQAQASWQGRRRHAWHCGQGSHPHQAMEDDEEEEEEVGEGTHRGPSRHSSQAAGIASVTHAEDVRHCSCHPSQLH